MSSSIAFIALFLLCAPTVVAQTQDDFRTEQFFIAPDRTSYGLTDTIMVDGVVTCIAHDNIKPYSNYVYIELINSDDSVIVRNKIRLQDNGTFCSVFPIDQLYRKGTYFLRGYTRFMENFSHDSFGVSPILIGKELPHNDSIIDDRISLRLIVPGNHIIPERPQLLSAVLTNYMGFPLSDKTLIISDNEGNITAQSTTSTSGYAHFIFVPEKNKSYRLRFSDSGIEKEIELPSSLVNKPIINAVSKKNQIIFDIAGAYPEDSRLYIFEKCNGLIKTGLSELSGMLTLPNTPVGPITLFLTDQNNKILSELSILPRIKQTGTLNVADTIAKGNEISYSIGNFDTDSCITISRFVPADDIWAQSAYSSLLFSDLSSDIPFPNKDSQADVSQQDIDAWLKSATFTRFNLKEIADLDSLFSYRTLPEFSMALKGRVYDDENAKHPMNKGTIVAYNNYDRLPFDTEVDSKGFFSVYVSDFPAGTEFFLQGINSKGVIKSTIITLVPDTFPPAQGFSYIKPFARNRYSTGETAISESGNSKPRELPDVIIKAKTQRDEIPNDKAFYGVKFKSREEIEEHNYLTLKDIIRDMPFVELRAAALVDQKLIDIHEAQRKRKPFSIIYVPWSKRGANAGIVHLLIDDTKIDYDEYGLWMDMSEVNIESVEQLSIAEAKALIPFAMDGAINVKTRRLGPPKPKPSKGTRVWPMGLTITPPPSHNKIFAPKEPGRYKLLVDLISPDGQIESYCKPITVE